MDFKNLIVQSWNYTLRFLGPVLLVTLVQLVLIIVSFGILAPVTTAGYIQSLMLAVREGRQPQVGDLFSQMRLFLPLLIYFILVTMFVALGFMLLVIPGFAVIGFVAFASFYMIPLMTDRKLGLIEALKTSWDHVTRAPVSDHLILAILYVVIMSLGSSLPFAFLLTQPIATFLMIGAYLEKVAIKGPKDDFRQESERMSKVVKEDRQGLGGEKQQENNDTMSGGNNGKP